MKITIGNKRIHLNPETMQGTGSFEKYYKKLSGLASRIGVDENELKVKLEEAYHLTVKAEKKGKAQSEDDKGK